MATSTAKDTLVLATGFGRFHGVEDNPSKHLMAALGPLVAESPLGAHIDLRTQVLEVSGLACARYAGDTHPELVLPSTRPVVVVHCGVAATRSNITLEARAVNVADFGAPDERGWQPRAQPIDAQGPAQLSCALDVGALAQALAADGFPVTRSDDAGEFVCNYLYYRSLRACQTAPHVCVVFVHVPPFEAVPLELQLYTLVALVSKIRDALHKSIQ